ncbi:MAG TPA: hypothetical protein VFP72_15640, partial [Kineosporiaceae bacterium]|nr:hypothetical protein [Kineosporiaceae bacterium]
MIGPDTPAPGPAGPTVPPATVARWPVGTIRSAGTGRQPGAGPVPDLVRGVLFDRDGTLVED